MRRAPSVGFVYRLNRGRRDSEVAATRGPSYVPDRLLWTLVREENVGHTLYFHVVCGVVFS